MTQGQQLQQAVETGDVAELERFLGDDPALAHRDVHNKLKPLQLAVYARQPGAVETLLRHGAKLNLCMAAGGESGPARGGGSALWRRSRVRGWLIGRTARIELPS